MPSSTTFDTDTDDWLEVGSNTDTDSVFSVDTASEDDVESTSVSGNRDHLRPHSSLSLTSSRSDDLNTEAEDDVEDDFGAFNGLRSESAIVSGAATVPVALTTPGERAIFDEDLPGTSPPSQILDPTIDAQSPQSSTYNLQLSFPDPLTSSRDQAPFDPPGSASSYQESFTLDELETQTTGFDPTASMTLSLDEAPPATAEPHAHQDSPLSVPGDYLADADKAAAVNDPASQYDRFNEIRKAHNPWVAGVLTITIGIVCSTLYPQHLASKTMPAQIKLPEPAVPTANNQVIPAWSMDIIPRIASSAIPKSQVPPAQATAKLPPLPTTFREFAIAVFQPPPVPALIAPSRTHGAQNQTPAPAETCRSPSWAAKVFAPKQKQATAQVEPSHAATESAHSAEPIASTSALSVRLTTAISKFMSSEDVQELLAWTTDPTSEAPRRVFKKRHARARANAKRIRKKLESQVTDFFNDAIDQKARSAYDSLKSKQSRKVVGQHAASVIHDVASKVKEGRKRARKRARELAREFA